MIGLKVVKLPTAHDVAELIAKHLAKHAFVAVSPANIAVNMLAIEIVAMMSDERARCAGLVMAGDIRDGDEAFQQMLEGIQLGWDM